MALPGRRWRVTVLGAGLYFSFTFAWNALAALIPRIGPDVGLTEFQTGVLLGVVALTIFLTWPVVGPLVERMGAARAMGYGVILLGMAGVLRGFVDSFLALSLLMAVLSLGGSTVTYGLPGVVASWFPSDSVGTPLGIVSTAATLGIVICFEFVPTISDAVGGWERALVVSSLPAVGLGALWLGYGSIGPYHDQSDAPSLDASLQLLRRPDVALLVVAGVAYLFATHSINGWLAPLFIERGFPYGDATRLVALITAGEIVGMLAIPAIADRLSARVPAIGLSGVAFAGLLSLIAVLEPRFAVTAGLVVIAGAAIGGISPLLRALPIELVPSGSVSTVIAMIFGIGGIGGFVGPVLVGTSLSVTGSLLVGFATVALPGIAFVAISVALSRQPWTGDATGSTTDAADD